MSDRPARPYLWMLSSALSFSSMGAISKLLAVASDWRLLAFVRAVLMLVFAGALGATTRTRFSLKATPMLWMRSLVGSLSMICTFYTLTHLPFSEATTLIKCYPLWVAVLSWLVLGDRPSAKVWVAILIGVAGVVMIAQPHFDEARVALAVGILSSICTAVVMLGLNKLANVDARAIVLHFAVVSTVVIGLVYAVFAGVNTLICEPYFCCVAARRSVGIGWYPSQSSCPVITRWSATLSSPMTSQITLSGFPEGTLLSSAAALKCGFRTSTICLFGL
jgi:drug/metabolite transporter (DMT)-like permease